MTENRRKVPIAISPAEFEIGILSTRNVIIWFPYCERNPEEFIVKVGIAFTNWANVYTRKPIIAEPKANVPTSVTKTDRL